MRMPGRRVDDVVRQALRHESGADHADADGPSFCFPGFQALSTMIMLRFLRR